VNGVNGGDTVFYGCLSACVCLHVYSEPVYQTTAGVKATDFKSDVHLPTDSSDTDP